MKKRFVATSLALAISAVALSQQQAAYAQITSPSNNSFLIAGSNQVISWKVSDDPTSIVLLQYTTNAGYTWNHIATSGMGAGSYDWIIPVATNSYLCKVRIVRYTGRGYAQVASTGIFSIARLDPLTQINEVFSHRVLSLTDTSKHHYNRIKWFK